MSLKLGKILDSMRNGTRTKRPYFFSFLRVMGIGFLIFLSGCGRKYVILHTAGPLARDEKNLLIGATLLMLLVVIPVIVMTFVFAYKYRASAHEGSEDDSVTSSENVSKPEYAPEWSKNVLLEVVWWSIPCVIVLVLGVVTWVSTHKLDPMRPIYIQGKKPLTIQVIALNWKWLFIYPKQNIATLNFVQFPVDTPVVFQLTSDGPINSFMIESVAGQLYAMAGMKTTLNLVADTLGVYRGLSVDYSGAGFSDMRFNAKVTSQADFEHWVAKVKATGKPLSKKIYRVLERPSNRGPVRYFSPVTGNIFQYELDKYDHPSKTQGQGMDKQDKDVNRYAYSLDLDQS